MTRTKNLLTKEKGLNTFAPELKRGKQHTMVYCDKMASMLIFQKQTKGRTKTWQTGCSPRPPLIRC